jgi:hypothetical protein
MLILVLLEVLIGISFALGTIPSYSQVTSTNFSLQSVSSHSDDPYSHAPQQDCNHSTQVPDISGILDKSKTSGSFQQKTLAVYVDDMKKDMGIVSQKTSSTSVSPIKIPLLVPTRTLPDLRPNNRTLHPLFILPPPLSIHTYRLSLVASVSRVCSVYYTGAFRAHTLRLQSRTGNSSANSS